MIGSEVARYANDYLLRRHAPRRPQPVSHLSDARRRFFRNRRTSANFLRFMNDVLRTYPDRELTGLRNTLGEEDRMRRRDFLPVVALSDRKSTRLTPVTL